MVIDVYWWLLIVIGEKSKDVKDHWFLKKCTYLFNIFSDSKYNNHFTTINYSDTKIIQSTKKHETLSAQIGQLDH